MFFYRTSLENLVLNVPCMVQMLQMLQMLNGNIFLNNIYIILWKKIVMKLYILLVYILWENAVWRSFS